MKKNSLKGSLYNFIGFIVVAGAIVAFLQISSGGNIWEKAKIKSGQVDLLVDKCVADFSSCGTTIDTWLNTDNGLSNNSSQTNSTDNSSSQPSSQAGSDTTTSKSNQTSNTNEGISSLTATTNSKDTALKQLNSLSTVKSYTSVNYNRREWKHWVNVDGSSCWNTREEALYQQAVKGSLVLLDKDKKETSDKSKACSIKSGKWIDPYSNEIITDPQKTDLDHTSPLAATARAGGQSWDKATKQQFANDLDHLVVTSQKQNRTKSDKTPSEWMPENTSSHCDYAKIYVNILDKYGLQVSEADKSTLTTALNSCTS